MPSPHPAILAILGRSCYPVRVEIPLRLKKDSAGRLVYSIPLWYRVITAIMIAAIVVALISSGEAPSIVAWILLILLIAGLLYEERWIADTKEKQLLHSGGIWPLIKKTSLGFTELKGFRLSAFARGTVQGSAEEVREESKAYAMMEGRDKPDTGIKSFLGMEHKKLYIHLIAYTKEGETYLIDSLPARSAGRLKKTGASFAESCQTQFGYEEKAGQ